MDIVTKRREAFRAFCASQGGAAAVGRAAGVPPTTLYSYLDGKTRSLKGETQSRIAAAFNISEEQLYRAREALTCPVVGRIELGRGLMFFDDNPENFERVDCPPFGTETSVALRVVGDEVNPSFADWLLFYDDEKKEPGPEHLGQLCMLWLEDGRVVARWLRQGDQPGRYNLTGQAAPQIMNVAVRFASKVLGMTPPVGK
jgi:hypothetical protein